jgi:cell division protein FtsA
MEGRVQLVRGRRIAQSGAIQNIVSKMREWFMGNF